MKAIANLITFLMICLAQITSAQVSYTWDGSISTNFSNSGNWTPLRTVPLPTDKLIFNNGGTVTVTDVPDQTIRALEVSGSTQLSLSASTSNKTLTIIGTTITSVEVARGSQLTLKNNGGVQLDVAMGSGTTIEIGGSVSMEKGTFNVNDATLTLYGGIMPLQVISGYFSLGTGCDIMIGKSGETPDGQIVIEDDVFTTAPTITDMTINSANGVKLGNQAITVTGGVTFTDGDIETNNQGKLIFSSTAMTPVEVESSKIVGYASMEQRTLGLSSISFLGYSIASGIDDLGNVLIDRITGPAGVNFNNDNESIAATWAVMVDNQPVNGRNVTMQWFTDFDNNNDVGLPMQVYRYETGPNWKVVGGATEIVSSVNGLQTSATVLTTHFSDWTISSIDNALPVSLVSFDGHEEGGRVILNWTTASELNNDRFIVERLTNGEYVYLGTVKGNGTTSAVNSYSFTDDLPFVGNNYYRLVQVDFDGARNVFKAIRVECTTPVAFEVYPNPASDDYLNVAVNGQSGGIVQIKLFNAQGQRLLEKKMTGTLHLNILEGYQVEQGLYYVEVMVNGVSNTKRVVVN